MGKEKWISGSERGNRQYRQEQEKRDCGREEWARKRGSRKTSREDDVESEKQEMKEMVTKARGSRYGLSG